MSCYPLEEVAARLHIPADGEPAPGLPREVTSSLHVDWRFSRQKLCASSAWLTWRAAVSLAI